MPLPIEDIHNPAPALIEVMRGTMVESRHRGAMAIVDAMGHIVRSVGAIDKPIYPRSAIKPLQALPLLETGTADKMGLGDDEIALACASHAGEANHTERVAAWLAKAGMSADDLECGAHLPRDVPTSQSLIRGFHGPSPLHNNCSGKHTGFLCTAKCLGEETHGYINAEHPVQRRVFAAVGAMTDTDMDHAHHGIDGCGIPVVAITLHGLALGMARMADPNHLPDERRAAATRILNAMAASPLLVDGTGGMATMIMQVAGSTVRLKPGAEGVYCAALPDVGLGIAVKIEDGAMRAADLAMATILDRLDCFDYDQRMALHPFLQPRLHNVAGVEVGHLRPAAALDF